MNNTMYLLKLNGQPLALSSNREAIIAACDALRNVFAEARIHPIDPVTGNTLPEIHHIGPFDGGNYTVRLVQA